MSRILVLGDIHGSAKALEQVLDRCNYNTETDTIISLGDYVDGWPGSQRVVDILLQIPKLIPLLGNHDLWFQRWLNDTLPWYEINNWVSQGGLETLNSYGFISIKRDKEIPISHKTFFDQLKPWYLDLERQAFFVHGGFIRGVGSIPTQQPLDVLIWNRSLWKDYISYNKPIMDYNEVYIGHTSVGPNGPYMRGNIWNLDTGCGWEGCLSIMDIDTKQVWKSDLSKNLYPNNSGR